MGAQTHNIEEQWVTLDGHRMRYLHAGSGPPLLLIHGLLGYAFSWRYNMDALAQAHEVFALDLLGTGFSERVPGIDCSLRAAAGRVLRFLDMKGIPAADVVGTSHGGALAMTMALLGMEQGKQRVRRMALVAPGNPWSRGRQVLIRALATRCGARLFRALEPHFTWLRAPFHARMYGDRRRIPPGTLEGYLRSYEIPGTLDYGLQIARCWLPDMGRLKRELPRLRTIPTLLIWGSRDRVVPLKSARPLRAALGEPELAVIEGAGHLPYEEMPEEFNRVLTDFLRRAPG